MAEDNDLPVDSTSSSVNPTSQSTNNSSAESNEKEKERTALLSFINGNEDVRPGVYEGGLKSWECSIDLVQYLSLHPDILHNCNPTNILELGCGTSLPSLYLFQQALQSQSAAAGAYTLHLADYNYSVLRLVTLPNVFLSWVLTTNSHLLTLPSGDLDVTAELKSSFLSSLQSANINIGFISGAWGDEMLSLLPPSSHPQNGNGYDLVLGSETIYEPRTMGEFTNVLLGALGPSGRGLVSAKRIYFGVGGSVGGFIELVKKREAWNVWEVENVGREKGGVGGVILEVKEMSGIRDCQSRGDVTA